jgi:hypothetical protein
MYRGETVPPLRCRRGMAIISHRRFRRPLLGIDVVACRVGYRGLPGTARRLRADAGEQIYGGPALGEVVVTSGFEHRLGMLGLFGHSQADDVDAGVLVVYGTGGFDTVQHWESSVFSPRPALSFCFFRIIPRLYGFMNSSDEPHVVRGVLYSSMVSNKVYGVRVATRKTKWGRVL